MSSKYFSVSLNVHGMLKYRSFFGAYDRTSRISLTLIPIDQKVLQLICFFLDF